MFKDKLRPTPRPVLLLVLSAAAIGALVAVQFGEFFHWITIEQRLRGPAYATLIQEELIDRRTDPDSKSETELDKALAIKYNEECVKLGSGHMEPTLPAPTRCFSRKEVQGILTDLTLVASAVFTKNNITHFLDSGTLLGAVRHKGPIPFDQDVDIGIDEAGYEKIKSTPILFPQEYTLHVFDSPLHPKGSRYIQLPVRLIHRESTLYSDVFVYIDAVNEQGEKVTGPMTSGAFINCRKCPKVGKSEKTFQVPYDWIYPLQPCRFAGYDLLCPNQPTKYLLHMFGENYMTPEVFPY